jgi:hypothetical protein
MVLGALALGPLPRKSEAVTPPGLQSRMQPHRPGSSSRGGHHRRLPGTPQSDRSLSAGAPGGSAEVTGGKI